METNSSLLNIARFCPATSNLGPGRRAVVWVQGCKKRCPGCLAADWLEFKPNLLISPQELADRVFLESGPIAGLTFSGGEPMEQAADLALLAQIARHRQPNLNLICFSGYRLEQLRDSPPNPGVAALLAEIDVLVDGVYIQEQNDGVGLRGSRNQRFHFLSSALKWFDFENLPRAADLEIDEHGISLTGIPPLGLEPVLAILESFGSSHERRL